MRKILKVFGIISLCGVSALVGGIISIKRYKKSIKSVGSLHITRDKEIYAGFDYDIDSISKKDVVYMSIINDR